MGNHNVPTNSVLSLRTLLAGALTTSAALVVGSVLFIQPSTSEFVTSAPAAITGAPPTSSTYQGRYEQIPVDEVPVVTATAKGKDAPTNVVPEPTTTTVEPPVPTTTTPPPTTVAPPPPTSLTLPQPAPNLPNPLQDVQPSRVERCDNLDARQIVIDGCADILSNVTVPGTIGGYGLRPGNPSSCHPQRLGLDLGLGRVTRQGDERNLQGDAIAAYARANADRLGITLVLWEAPDHWDHVHLSFRNCTG